MMRAMMCLMAIVVGCMSMPASAYIYTTISAPAIGDAMVDSTGTAISEDLLAVQGTNTKIGALGSVQRSYLMFDLSSIPDNAVIVSAVFGIYVQTSSMEGYTTSDPAVGVYYVSDDSWTEASITWSNAPTYSYGGDYQYTVDNQYYEWDILSGMDMQWLYASDLTDNVISLMLMTEFESINNVARFYSSESAVYQPYLKITYYVTPEPATMLLLGMGSVGMLLRRKKAR